MSVRAWAFAALVSGCVAEQAEVGVRLATVEVPAGGVSESFSVSAAPTGALGLAVGTSGGEVTLAPRDGGAPSVVAADGSRLDRLAPGWWRAHGAGIVTVDARVPQEDPSIRHRRWMEDAGDAIADVRLDRLCLPGAHDAATSGINPDSPWGLGAGVLGGLRAEVAVRTSRAQALSLSGLLFGGVRYLDLRLEVGDDGTVRAVHGLLGERADGLLAEVASFLDAHPLELVILDVQAISGVVGREAVVSGLVEEVLGDRIAPPGVLGPRSRVGAFWEAGVQVLALADLPDGLGAKFHRRSDTLSSPWGNVQSVDDLGPFLDGALTDRPRDRLFVTQGVLTPDAAMAAAWAAHPDAATVDGPCARDRIPVGLCALARQATPAVASWVTTRWAAEEVNVVMVDHPELALLVEACLARHGLW